MIEFAVRRPVSVTMICLGIFVLGFISLKKMPIELLPNIELAEFQVITEYKGASAPEVEKTITIPIERALSIQEGLYHMESESLNNVSKITIRFRNGINIFESLSSVRDKVNEIGFPTGVNKPIVSRSIGKQTPILRIVINSKATNLESLNQFGKSLQETLLPLIEKVEGIALVQLSGIPQKEYQLIFDPVKMSVYQLSLEEVKGIITQSQSSIPAGNFQYQGENITLKLSNENFQLNEILNIVIKQIKNEKIILNNIVTFQEVYSPPTVRSYYQNSPSLILDIYKEADANSVDVGIKAKDEIIKFTKLAKEKINYHILIDQSSEIKKSIDNVIGSVIDGGILAALIIFLFLGQIKSSLVISMSIPLSIMLTMILMHFTGISFNLMSLGGLALGVGMLVDNSIVVLESINLTKTYITSAVEASIVGTKKIMSSIITSTMTTMAVFAPLIMVEGVMGQLFKQISLTVIYSLFASLVMAILFIPMISAIETKRKLKEKKTEIFFKENLMKIISSNADHEKYFLRKMLFLFQILILFHLFIQWKLDLAFKPIIIYLENKLYFCLGYIQNFIDKSQEYYRNKMFVLFPKKNKIITGTLLSVIISLFLLGIKEIKLFDSENSTKWNFTIELSPNKNINSAENLAGKISKKILIQSNIDSITHSISEQTENKINYFIKFKELENIKELKHSIISKIMKTPEVLYQENSESFLPASSDIRINVFSKDLNSLMDDGKKIYDYLVLKNEMTNIQSDLKSQIKELSINFSADKLMARNSDFNQFLSPIKSFLINTELGQIYLSGDYLPLKGKILNQSLDPISFLNELNIIIEEKPLYLKEVSTLEEKMIPSLIKRINRQRVITFKGDLNIDDKSNFKTELKKELNNKFPEIKSELIDKDEQDIQTENSLIAAIGLSVFIIFLLLAGQFESFKQPMIILIAVPLGFTGICISFYLLGYPISVMMLIGVVILSGVAVNTSILMVDTMNVNLMEKKENQSIISVIIESSCSRIRPILMTSLSTIIGLFPMLLATGEGADLNRPMALSIIAGLTSSTFLTLIIIPFIYFMMINKNEDAKLNNG